MKLDQIRWDSVAKIGAGALLAVAVATSAPSLLGSEEPEPLEPDVGLPQVAIPPPPPPAVAPSKRRKKKPRKEKPHKPRHRPKEPADDAPVGPSLAPPPVVAPAAPAGSAEDFGFEQP